jgi:hypothetical protein
MLDVLFDSLDSIFDGNITGDISDCVFHSDVNTPIPVTIVPRLSPDYSGTAGGGEDQLGDILGSDDD